MLEDDDVQDGLKPKAPGIDRATIPGVVAAVLKRALATGTIDGADVYALALKHGRDWRPMVHEILEFTRNNRNGANRIHTQSKMCKLVANFDAWNGF